MTPEFIVNHLWQSSCFALFAGVLAFMLRGNSPKVRYWIWLSASLKFLLPWALLVSLGNAIPWRATSAASPPPLPSTLIQLAKPLPPAYYLTVATRPEAHWGIPVLALLWMIGFIALVFIRLKSWNSVRAIVRAGTPVSLPIPVPALITPSATEPGVVGFLKPVLVLPELLLERLNPEQVEALLAHEMCHVRRRDNLFAALHMGVETIFWFHPAVWWIRSRMLEERELACDEEVLRLGHEPTDYVRGILTVCQHYSESRLPCVAGVTGADIKARIRTILSGNLARELSRHKKLALAFSAFAAVAVPVGLGIWNAPLARAQGASMRFDVTSVKPLSPKPVGFQGVMPACKGGHFEAITPVFITMEWAFDLQTPQQLRELQAKVPQWAQSISGSYELAATTRPDVTEEECRKMTQKLFEDRFSLEYHWETVTGKVYEMVVARKGFRMEPANPDAAASNVSFTINGREPRFPPESPVWNGVTMDYLARLIGGDLGPDSPPVIDKTGIQGKYKLKLAFSMGAGLNAPFADPDIFSAVEQQLGLKLQEARGPIQHFIVDSIAKPDPN